MFEEIRRGANSRHRYLTCPMCNAHVVLAPRNNGELLRRYFVAVLLFHDIGHRYYGQQNILRGLEQPRLLALTDAETGARPK
eukprot:9248102-Alexandrium_andersonii.AAC.1